MTELPFNQEDAEDTHERHVAIDRRKSYEELFVVGEKMVDPKIIAREAILTINDIMWTPGNVSEMPDDWRLENRLSPRIRSKIVEAQGLLRGLVSSAIASPQPKLADLLVDIATAIGELVPNGELFYKFQNVLEQVVGAGLTAENSKLTSRHLSVR